MYPIILDLALVKVVLVGDGEAALRRLALLDAAGDASGVAVYSASPDAVLRDRAGQRLEGERPSDEALKAAQLVFIAGLDEAETARIARIAREAGRLVNAEDVKPLCDFHVPSTVRRGELLLTVSTGGKSPGLARRLRRHIEALFGPEWAGRLEELADLRDDWRRQQVGMSEIGRRTDAYVEEKGWLP
jgi:precorrin-2 dehydrogenase / sirohydrochlorin ferrochelatase